MKVFYHRISQTGTVLYGDSDHILNFPCLQPTIIQPGEIKKVPTGITLKIEKGNILTIYTPSELWQIAAEVFPAVLILDHSAPETPLEIPVRNSGRNQLNLLAGQTVACGIGSKITSIQIQEFEPVSKKTSVVTNRPQKKNPDVKFEIR